MNKNKIDERLFLKINCQALDEGINCFVYYSDRAKIFDYLNRQGLKCLYNYSFINAFYCNITKEQIFDLSQLNDVEYISSQSLACCQMFVSKRILNTTSQELTGDGVGVAFIDTGIYPHSDFLIGKNRIKFFKDFIHDKKHIYDDNGHGTFVAGVSSGSGCLSKFTYSGIAPKSEMFILKALDKNGEANASKILDAMEWVYDNHESKNIKVVCMSFGSEPIGLNDPIMKGANALWRDGVVVVAAAGNSGPNTSTIKSPGISFDIITVGGFDDNRIDNKTFNKNFFEMATFSSRGPAFSLPKPDLIAPSVDVVSCGIERFYTTLSGTSVATPMIAGVVCLLLERYRDLRPNEVKSKLLGACNSLGFDINSEGFGVPDVKKIISSF